MRYWWLLLFTLAGSTAGGATYIWSGAAGDGKYNNPANWQGGFVPPNDGNAVLVFNNAGVVGLPLIINVSQIQFQTNQGGTAFSSNFISVVTLHNGISLSGGTNRMGANVALALANDQSVAVNGGSLEIAGTIAGNAALTKTGAGNLTLSGLNLFGGGVVNSAGTVTLTNSLSLGVGALHLAGGNLAIASLTNLDVPNAVSLEANTRLESYTTSQVSFSGDVTLANSVSLQASGTSEYVFTGNLNESGGSRKLTVTGLAPVVLSGESHYTGGTSVDGGSLVFAISSAVPKKGTVASSSMGYVGAAFTGQVQANLIGRIDPATFYGTLGLDTLPGQETPTVFNESIDVSGLANFYGLGSSTTARLKGQVLIAKGADYRFGGGGGTLFLESNLGSSGKNLQVVSHFGTPLELVLRGTNTFTGQANVLNSVLVLDSKNAVGGGKLLNITGPGYIGYTENFGGNPNAFLGKFGTIGSTDAIFGLDSANLYAPRTISDSIDLSLGGQIGHAYYLGTSSKVILTGAITPATNQSLYLTAVKGGDLVVRSTLGSNIPGLVVGQSNSFDPQGGTVELAGSNSFSGGTRVLGGTLLVSNSSALGANRVDVTGGNLAIGTNVLLANPLNVGNGAMLSGSGSLATPGGTVIQNGAILAPGGLHAIGTLNFNTGLTLGSGAVIDYDVASTSRLGFFATDRINVVGAFNLLGGGIPITINLASISPEGTDSPLWSFDPKQNYSWQFVTASSIHGFAPSAFDFNLSGFSSDLAGGSFFVSQSGSALMINFTPVPEPGTIVLFGLGLAAVIGWEFKRRRK